MGLDQTWSSRIRKNSHFLTLELGHSGGGEEEGILGVSPCSSKKKEEGIREVQEIQAWNSCIC